MRRMELCSTQFHHSRIYQISSGYSICTYPAIDSKVKRVYVSTMPGYNAQGYGQNSLIGVDLTTGKLIYRNWLYTDAHWSSIGHPLSSRNNDGIVYLSGRTLMAFNGENGQLRFLRARTSSNDERVDSAAHDTNILNINYLGKQPGPLNYRQTLSLWDGDRGQLIWNVSVPNSYFYVNYPATTNVRSRDHLHLTAQENIIVGRLPSSNQPVWTFNSSVAQSRVARLGVTDDSLFVVVIFFTHQELWKISLPKSFVEHQQSMWLDCFGQCNSYWTTCYSYDCKRCAGLTCQS